MILMTDCSATTAEFHRLRWGPLYKVQGSAPEEKRMRKLKGISCLLNQRGGTIPSYLGEDSGACTYMLRTCTHLDAAQILVH